MKRQEGLQDPQLEAYNCPRCIDEVLIRKLGNLLVCPNCDINFITPKSNPEPIVA